MSFGPLPDFVEPLLADLDVAERSRVVGLTHTFLLGVNPAQRHDAMLECLIELLPEARSRPFMDEAKMLAEPAPAGEAREPWLMVLANEVAWPADGETVLVSRSSEQQIHDQMVAAALRMIARGGAILDRGAWEGFYRCP